MDIKGKKWSPEDIKFLNDNYESMGFKDLSHKLERSIESIRSKLKRSGLVKENKIQPVLKNSIISKGPIGKATKIDARKSHKKRVPYKTVEQNFKKMVPVYIDSKTTIYIKEGEDHQAAREKYHLRMSQRTL